MPPFAEAEATPLLPPKQLTAVVMLAVAVSAVGCVRVVLALAVHPFASVMESTYVPAMSEEMSSFVLVKLPGPLQLRPNGVVPPTIVALIDPVEAPEQLMFVPPTTVGALREALSTAGASRVYVAEVEQRLDPATTARKGEAGR